MDVAFDDDALEALETDARAHPNFPAEVVRAYRKRIWQIRAAHDERDFYKNRGLHFKKHKSQNGRYSMRLNDQYRLMVRFQEHSENKTVVIVEIVDYH